MAQKETVSAEVAISDGMAKLMANYYGKGPAGARTYYTDDLVVVRLEETFTRAEQTLVDRGEKDLIQSIRRRFQQTMAEELKAIVVQATGREVKVFLSETNIESDISVEIFFLGAPREDMSTYEN